jgi:hypothetical protein
MAAIYQKAWPIAFIVTASLAIGCALPLGRRTVDVTRDPRFACGYRQGQVYRLRTDVYLMACLPGTENEAHYLWSKADFDHYNSPNSSYAKHYVQLATIPAGSLIQIERLEYSYDDYFPPFPPGGSVIVQAYGTLVTPSMRWERVIAPIGPRSDARDLGGVDLFLPDTGLVEKVR